MSSDIGESNSGAGPQEVDPNNTLVISREKPRSRRAHVCGVNNSFRRNTSKEPLDELRPIWVTFQG